MTVGHYRLFKILVIMSDVWIALDNKRHTQKVKIPMVSLHSISIICECIQGHFELWNVKKKDDNI